MRVDPEAPTCTISRSFGPHPADYDDPDARPGMAGPRPPESAGRRLGNWLRHAPAERIPPLAVPVVWTAGEILHAAGAGAVIPGAATVAAASLAYTAGERRAARAGRAAEDGGEAHPRLRGAELAAAAGLPGAWLTAASIWGPLAGPYDLLTLAYITGAAGGYWWLRAHEAVRAARRRRDDAATAATEALERRARWHTLARQLGLPSPHRTHLIEWHPTHLGETWLVDVRGTGKRASQLAARDLAERLAEIRMLPPGRVKVTTDRLAGRLRITVRDQDPWANPVGHPLVTPDSPYLRYFPEPATIRDGIVIGIDPETGNPLRLFPWEADQGGKVIQVTAKKGSGKALALDTPLPAPGGWTTMAEVGVGDYVLGQDGKPALVTAATEIMYGRPCYEVEFSDGTVIVADAEHRWLTEDRRSVEAANNVKFGVNRVRHAFPEVRTTAEIAATLRYGWNQRLNHAIANCRPLDLPEADLPIPPYTLGAWLGDGTSRRAEISSADPEILAQIEAEGVQVTKQPWGKYEYHLAFPGSKLSNSLQSALRTLGVLQNKHIPGRYLRASEDQRRALLAGLLDADGYCTKPLPRKSGGGLKGGGQVVLALTNERLASDARDLISSLGYTSRIITKTVPGHTAATSSCYIISFTPGDTVFRLPRKAARQHTAAWSGLSGRRFITDVRPVPSVPVRCIAVGNDAHLYLAGRTCIPTHNTVLMTGVSVGVARCRDAVLIQVNLSKAREDRCLMPLAAANALGRGELGRARRALAWVAGALEARSHGGTDAVFQPSPATPLIVVKIDEAWVVTDDEECNAHIAYIASQCRSEGAALIMAGQRATAKKSGGSDIQANIDTAVVGRVSRQREANHATGGEMSDIIGYGEGRPGVFEIFDLGEGGDPDRGRVFNLRDIPQIERLVRQLAATLRPYEPEPALAPLGGLWGKVTGAAPGGRALDDDGGQDQDDGGAGYVPAAAARYDTSDVQRKAAAAVAEGTVAAEFAPLPPGMEDVHAQRHAQALADYTGPGADLPAGDQAALRAMLARPEGVSTRTAAAALPGKWSHTHVSRQLRRWAAQGGVVKDGRGSRQRWRAAAGTPGTPPGTGPAPGPHLRPVPDAPAGVPAGYPQAPGEPDGYPPADDPGDRERFTEAEVVELVATWALREGLDTAAAGMPEEITSQARQMLAADRPGVIRRARQVLADAGAPIPPWLSDDDGIPPGQAAR